MHRVIRRGYWLLLWTVFATTVAYATSSNQSQQCHGRFVNPITDVCWSCLFPISIGSSHVVEGKPDTPNPTSPVCLCWEGMMPRMGITLGFWEPARLVDVTQKPFCFPNLNGMELNVGHKQQKGAMATGERAHAMYHVHWYTYPLLYWMGILTHLTCVEKGSFDIAYLTELDPLWNDDALNFILNPESALFANPVAQAACSADCTSSSTHLPQDKLFWCAGCQGSMYPLAGTVGAHVSPVDSALLLTERMTFKLHRAGLVQSTRGSQALCGSYYQSVMQASSYRYQMVNPSRTDCYPFGASSVHWVSGKSYPVKGEDFGFLIWRKRNCCAY